MRISTGGTPSVDITDELTRLVGTTRDWWLNEIRAGRAFTGGARVSASVGNFSEIQLINPAASGVTMIVRRIVAGVQTAADRLQLRTHNAQLATAAMTGVNLLSGGAAAAGLIRSAQPAAADGTLAREVVAGASLVVEIANTWDFELGAGEGVLVVPVSVNIDVAASFLWVEF